MSGMAIRSLIEAAARGATRAPSQPSVDDLINQGYPESVARRIASGELPMDYASRMQRASDQGYDLTPYYSGYDAIRGVKDARLGNQPITEVTESLWASDNPLITGTYSASLGGGNIHPLLMRNPEAVMDAKGNQWQNLLGIDVTPESYSSQLSTNDFARAARESGASVAEIQNVVDYGNKAGRMKNLYPDFEDLTKGGSNVRVDMSGNNTRSLLSAAFDPEYTGPNIMGLQGGSQSPSMLGSVASSAVGAASTASDSDEDKLYRGLTDKMVDYLSEQMGGSEEDRKIAEYISMGMDFLPFIGAAKGVSETFDAYKNDDKLGMALGVGGTLAGLIPFGRAAYKGGLGIIEDAPTVTRDTGLLQRVGDPESVNTMKIDVEPGVDLLPARQIRAEDLEGRGFVSGMADTSRGDLSRVVSINDNPVNMVRFGGQDYMRQPSNADQGVLWASDAGAVTGLLNAARAASDLPGVSRSPVYMPYQMSGTSTDFATMTADIMVPIAKRNMSKADKKALDKRIREGKGNKKDDFTPQPDWPGIDSPKADEWLASSGGNRKAITKAIDEFRDSAGINLSQARAAIVDPDQLNPRLGNLRQVGVLDLSRPAMPGSHPSYNTDIMGTYLGQLGEGASLFSDVNPLIRSSRKPFIQEMIGRGYDLSAAKLPPPVGKAMQPGLIGAFDQATLDDLIKKGLIAP